MATIEFDDPKYHVEIVSTNAISLRSDEFRAFLEALSRVNSTVVPTALDVSAGPGSDFTYALDAANGRHYDATLRLTAHQRAVTSTSFFTLSELLNHNPLVEAVFGLLDLSVTSIEVTWV